MAEAIHEEEDRAERNLQNAGFQEQQVYALMEATRAWMREYLLALYPVAA